MEHAYNWGGVNRCSVFTVLAHVTLIFRLVKVTSKCITRDMEVCEIITVVCISIAIVCGD